MKEIIIPNGASFGDGRRKNDKAICHTLGFCIVGGICVVDRGPQLRLGQKAKLPTFHAVGKHRCDPLPPALICQPLQFIPLPARTLLTWLAFLNLSNDR
ncbi:hypothetical protein TIFTF001_025420 [Ficus carica]|uniref:Uncharacterized protein n=1 Tax=Ficus carica TaxID=3494 RepID=A0AA88AMW3_FICCA|nr:hypothetical protein TIFTF001_025420 [Ficus carica]